MKYREQYIEAAMKALDFDGSMREYIREVSNENEEQLAESEIDKICIEAIELYNCHDIAILSSRREDI